MELNSKKPNYRELQALAKKLQLPGNLKHHLLHKIIEARSGGNEMLVQQILSEQKIERAKRKSEKLENRDAGYRHLNIFQERQSAGRPRKVHLQTPPQDSFKMKSHSVQDTYLRSLLALPHKSLRDLMMKTQQESMFRNQQPWEAARSSYQQVGFSGGHCSSHQLLAAEPYQSPIVINNEYSTKYRYPNKPHPSCVNSVRNGDTIENFKPIDYNRNHDKPRQDLHEPFTPMYAPVVTAKSQAIPSFSEFNNILSQPKQEYSYIYQSNQLEYVTPHYQEGTFNNVEYWRRFPDKCNYRNPDESIIIEEQVVSSTPNSDTMSATEPEYEHNIPYPHPNEIQPSFNVQLTNYPPVFNYFASENQPMYNPPSHLNQVVFESEVQDYTLALQPISDPLYLPPIEKPSGSNPVANETLYEAEGMPLEGKDLDVSEEVEITTSRNEDEEGTSADVTLLNVIDQQEYQEWSYKCTTTTENCLSYVHGVSHSSYFQLP